MDGGAWWAAVHGVAKSRTRLSNFTFTFHFYALEEEMATHSSVLAWRIPGMGSHRVGHDWSDLAAAAATSLPTPVSNSTPTNKAKLHPCQWQPTTPSDHLTLFQKHFHFFHPQPDTSMSTQAIFYNPPRAMVLLLILALTRNTGLWFFLPQTTVRNPSQYCPSLWHSVFCLGAWGGDILIQRQPCAKRLEACCLGTLISKGLGQKKGNFFWLPPSNTHYGASLHLSLQLGLP